MKLEVFNLSLSTEKLIEIYSISDLTMLDFQEWQEQNEVVINLNHLSHEIANLDSKDPETGESISNSREVDFYLPDPIKNRAISQFVESETGTEEHSEPVLKSSTILSAVVTEILQNHHPHSDYKVKISDG